MLTQPINQVFVQDFPAPKRPVPDLNLLRKCPFQQVQAEAAARPPNPGEATAKYLAACGLRTGGAHDDDENTVGRKWERLPHESGRPDASVS
jgi:hypothetical protein